MPCHELSPKQIFIEGINTVETPPAFPRGIEIHSSGFYSGCTINGLIFGKPDTSGVNTIAEEPKRVPCSGVETI
jgi:hypothetical protein